MGGGDSVTPRAGGTLAERINGSADAVLAGKQSIQQALGDSTVNPTFAYLTGLINNLNQVNLDGRNSVRVAIINKDNKVTIPVNPTYDQLVTGVNSINANQIDIDFTMTNVGTVRQLSSTVPFNVSTATDSGKYTKQVFYWKYDQINKCIWYVGNFGFYRYNISLDTWTKITTSSLSSSEFNLTNITFGVGTDGNLYLVTYASGSTTFAYSWKLNTTTLAFTALPNVPLAQPSSGYRANFCAYSLFWKDEINFMGYDSHNYMKKYKISTNTWSTFGVNFADGIALTLGNFLANQSALFISLTSGSNDGTHCYIIDETTATSTKVSQSDTQLENFRFQDHNAGYLGRGKFSINGYSIYDCNLYTIGTKGTGLKISSDGESNGSYDWYPITYDWDKGNLYFVRSYRGGTNQGKFGVFSTDIENWKSTNDLMYNYTFDPLPLIQAGLKVFLTIKSSCNMLTTGGSSDYTSITNQRIQLTVPAYLKFSGTTLQGKLEITQ